MTPQSRTVVELTRRYVIERGLGKQIMAKSLFLGTLVIAMPLLAAAEFNATEFKKIHEDCKAAVQDKRLDILRDKIQLYNDEVSLPPERRPNPTEVAALRVLYSKQVRCLMAYGRPLGQEVDSPLFLTQHAHEQLSALALLMNGYATYGDYARWKKARLKEDARYVEAELKKQQEEVQRAQAAQSAVLLSCIAENPQTARGVEFQYQINQQSSSVWANRGSGLPADVRIGESEISFTQGDSRVAISRITGVFSIVAGTLIISGKCNKATAKAF